MSGEKGENAESEFSSNRDLTTTLLTERKEIGERHSAAIGAREDEGKRTK